MSQIRAVLCLLILVISLFTFRAEAQTDLPYTRYGLGTLIEPEFTNLRGWGGLSAAYHNPVSINFANPASYSDISLTTFDAAAFGSFLTIRTSPDTSDYFGDGSVANIALGFPIIRNKMGASFGILPYSRVNYAVLQPNDSTPEFGQSFNLFEGEGGLYNFFAGTGFKYKNLSAGINASYIFGAISYSNILAFPDTVNAYNTQRKETRNVGDFLFTGGLQYRFQFGKNKDYNLDLGVSGNLKTNLHAKRDLVYTRFTYLDQFGNTTTIPNPYDTIYSELDSSGDLTIPGAISAGFIFSHTNRFSVGVNYKYGMWSDFRTFGEKDMTTDSWKLSAGVEFVPDYDSYQEYWKLISYRLGFSTGKDYLEFDGNDLRLYTITVGAGFPLRRVFSRISVAGEWTHTGSLDTNPLTASYFRLSAGFTLADKWFQKRKFE